MLPSALCRMIVPDGGNAPMPERMLGSDRIPTGSRGLRQSANVSMLWQPSCATLRLRKRARLRANALCMLQMAGVVVRDAHVERMTFGPGAKLDEELEHVVAPPANRSATSL